MWRRQRSARPVSARSGGGGGDGGGGEGGAGKVCDSAAPSWKPAPRPPPCANGTGIRSAGAAGGPLGAAGVPPAAAGERAESRSEAV